MDDAQRKQIKIGAVLIAIGMMLVANRLQLPWVWRLWPAVLIVVGVPKLLAADVDTRARGVWVTSIGAILILHTLGAASLRFTWPLFLVPLGLALLLATGASATKKAD